MAVVPRQRKDKIVFYVSTYFDGETYWERSGTDRREAERLDKRRKREVASGTYQPKVGSAGQVGSFFSAWFSVRTAKANSSDSGMFRNHVSSREWFIRLRMDDVRPRHLQKLFEEIKAESGLAPKSVHNLFAVVRSAFRSAMRQEVIDRDPCQLEPGTLSKKGKVREIYDLDELRRLVDPKLVGSHRAVWNAIGFFTGARMGEICGLRWSDWTTDTLPLGSLTIDSQYIDQPLKTDRPRRAPVHVDLAKILQKWWAEGFELHYLRKPTPNDFIVPHPIHVELPIWNKTIGYKLWRKGCELALVENRTEHSVRHSFLTHVRRYGASKEKVERITHNASGEMVDHYTHWEWQPLCEAASFFPSLIDAEIDASSEGLILLPLRAPTPGLEQGLGQENERKTAQTTENCGSSTEGEKPPNRRNAANSAARQFSELLSQLVAAGMILGVIPFSGGDE